MKSFASTACTNIDDDIPCQVCITQLVEYIYAEIAGDSQMERFAKIVMHLDKCESCMHEYQKLKEIAQLAYTTEVFPTSSPRFDLSFLNQIAQNPSADRPKGSSSTTPTED